MDIVNLQIPINKKVRDSATKLAKEYGYSSLQEVIRVMVASFANRELKPTFEKEEIIKLSPEAEARYAKMDEDFKAGKNVKSFKSVEELMKDLRS